MLAAYVDELGPPEQIQYGDLPDPEPGAGQVRVRVEATVVDPVDTFVRSGRFPTPTPFPFVVGRDLVGLVDRVGPDVTEVAAGDRVWTNSLGHGGRQGAAAQRAVVPTDRLYPLPDGADPVRTVALLHPGATAFLALFTHGRLQPGQTVYVAGAGGHVGASAVAMAHRAGARVVASAAARDLQECRSAGAEVALDYRDPDLFAGLARAAPDGVDVWLDTSGRQPLAEAVERLATRGRIVVMAQLGAAQQVPVGRLYPKDGSIVGFAISNASAAELADAAAYLNGVLTGGTLPDPPVEVLALSQAAAAHRRLEQGETGGSRLVLRVPQQQ